MDLGQMEQVVMNLAVNARDAMPNGGNLIIRTENAVIDKNFVRTYSYARTGKFVCLGVDDTGIGMDNNTIQQIFEPFFTTKKTGEGTGLGLSVVYGIIKEHQGWINVSSEPGKGSKFEIYLPASFDKSIPEKKSPIHSYRLQGNGERILFVEDDKTIRDFMRKELRKNGYRVYTAENGKSTIDIFKRENCKIDLLFTDVVLPDRRGIELVDTLLSYNPELKVLFTSGYLDKKSEWPYIKERNFPFIEKPYTLNDLLRAIQESITTH
jgi:CheY-like chemotaxis protein